MTSCLIADSSNLFLLIKTLNDVHDIYAVRRTIQANRLQHSSVLSSLKTQKMEAHHHHASNLTHSTSEQPNDLQPNTATGHDAAEPVNLQANIATRPGENVTGMLFPPREW
jgi:hypothetical protein